MKFQVGDLVLVKDYEWKFRSSPYIWPRSKLNILKISLPPSSQDDLNFDKRLINTFGVITQAINHKDAWEGGKSTNGDNVYAWFSQVDARTHMFYENEVTGEIIK